MLSKNVLEAIIKQSKKSKYYVSKLYGKDITQYCGKEIRLCTLVQICEIIGYEIIIRDKVSKNGVRVTVEEKK